MTGQELCDDNTCLCKGMRGSFFPYVIIKYPGQAHMAVHATYNREAGRFESSGPDQKGVYKQAKTCGLYTLYKLVGTCIK